MAHANKAPGVDACGADDFLAVGPEELRDPAEGPRAEALGAGLRGQEVLGEVLLGGWEKEEWVQRERRRREGERRKGEEGARSKKDEKKNQNSQ